MGLTQVEELLICFLKSNGMTEEETAGTMLYVNTMQETIQMIKWIASKGRPSPQEILNHLGEMKRAGNWNDASNQERSAE